jgi:hypothetical protein
MRRQLLTRDAERAARRILTRWRTSARCLADIPSIARIIDDETHRPELFRLHVRYETLLAAYIDLLAFAESECARRSGDGTAAAASEIERAHAVLDEISEVA